MVEASVMTVCITGAAGQIGYSIIPMIAQGQMFGSETRVALKLLDIPQCENGLRGVAMEIEDGTYPLVASVEYGSDARQMFSGCDLIVFLGGFPRKQGMERKELLQMNANIFKAQGEAANDVCSQNCKFVVVANPANTNCLILSTFASNLPKKNFSCLTRLDHNRAKAQIAARISKKPAEVDGVIIWGNHSSTQYPDVNHGTIAPEGTPIRQAVGDDTWLNTDFITTVQKRGAAIIAARGLSSAMSAAYAVVDHVRDWRNGTGDKYVSMGIVSEGQYGIEAGLVYSYPVITNGFEYEVKTGLEIDEFSREKMTITENELKEEKADALS